MIKVLELTLILAVCLLIGIGVSNNNNRYNKEKLEIKIEHKIETEKVEIKPTKKLVKCKTFKQFLDTLSWRESSGNWKVINRFGYMGKYQLGKLALKDIKMDYITAEEFRKDSSIFPEKLQDIAIKKYINKNKRYLRKYITSYDNKTIHGILITESGIIGAAHLVGHRSVKEWLKCDGNVKKVDGNGVSIESYLKLFSGYTLT